MSLRTALSSRTAVRLYLVASSAFVLLFLMDAFLLPWIIHSRSEITIPNLEGLPLARAEQMLTDRGLQPIVSKREPSEKYPPGHVSYQDPAAMAVVREGRNVYLTVSGGGEKVAVPNLRGRSLRDVKITLEQIDLRLGMITYQPSQLPIETVLSQSIPPATSVAKRTAVDISLSNGAEAGGSDVPYLVGLTLEQAQESLKAAGLHAGKITWKVSPGLTPKTVLSQIPAAGEKADANTPVDLTLVQ